MDLIGRIRRLHGRDKKLEREIARITGLSRNTVSKWLHGQVDGPPKYQRGEQPTKLSAFHEALRQALAADARRPRQQRRTARALYTEIKAAGYDGGYTRVTDFIRAWRQGEGQGAATNAFIPLAFALGEAYQFDWSEEGLVVGGIYYRVQVAGVLAGGLSQPGPRDAIRRPHTIVHRARRRGPARHLRLAC